MYQSPIRALKSGMYPQSGAIPCQMFQYTSSKVPPRQVAPSIILKKCVGNNLSVECVVLKVGCTINMHDFQDKLLDHR